MQVKKLRAMVEYAYRNVPFHHKKFRESGIRPDDVKTIHDLKKIPITTKAEIQAAPLKDVLAANIDVNTCIQARTSGSTGAPMTVFHDRNAEDYGEALWFRAFLRNGVRLRDKTAVIRNPIYFQENARARNNRFLEALGLMRRRYISAVESVQRQMEHLEAYDPDIIKSYPSCIKAMAMTSAEDFCLSPRMIFTGSELVDDFSRKLISSAFNCELLDCYGTMEFNLLSWECREHSGYHMNVESVLLEFLEDNEPVAYGERGKIVCTGLINYAMPLIRYDLADIGVPIEDRCGCGVTLPLMKMLEGRADDFLIALDGTIIPPTAILNSFAFAEVYRVIREFKVIQEERDNLTVQLVLKDVSNCSEQYCEQTFEKIKNDIQLLLGKGMQVNFKVLSSINKDASGKVRVVSRLIPANLPCEPA